MNISINDIITKSKNRIDNLYFRIVKKDDEDEYDIIQYVGPHKSATTMMIEGWNKFLQLKSFINVDYPVFDINDFKSIDGLNIIKKDDDDITKDAFKEILEYCNMNRNLIDAFSSLKKFLQKIKVDFFKYKSFDEVISFSKSYIESLSLSQIDKANLIFELTNLRIKIFEELEKMNVESPVRFLSEKFKYFLMVV